jgi:hypothetical protein
MRQVRDRYFRIAQYYQELADTEPACTMPRSETTVNRLHTNDVFEGIRVCLLHMSNRRPNDIHLDVASRLRLRRLERESLWMRLQRARGLVPAGAVGKIASDDVTRVRTH